MTLQNEIVSFYQSRNGYLITSDHKDDCATEAWVNVQNFQNPELLKFKF